MGAASRDYVVRLPPDRHIVIACEDAGCDNWRYGWDTILDERDPARKQLADWIRSGASGRDYAEIPGAGVTVFRFAARQRCFAEHRTRPARLLVRDGRTVTEHSSFAAMAQDYNDHKGHLAGLLQKG
jgi:hypothetical protein